MAINGELAEGGLLVISNDAREHFGDISEAAAYLGSRVTNAHFLVQPFQPEVLGRLTDIHGIQHLELFAPDGRSGRTPRFRQFEHESGVTVSTLPEPALDVVVRIADWSGPLLDRGLSWVQVHQEVPPQLRSIILTNHNLDEAAISEQLGQIGEKALQLIEGVLESNPEPPFARTP
jgi:hypothetical protein